MSPSTLGRLVLLATTVAGAPHPGGGQLRADGGITPANAPKAAVVDLTKVKLATQSHPSSETYYLEYKRVDPYFEVIFYVIAGCFVIFLTTLAGCCVYDSVAHWRHLAYFRSCSTQVRRVHDMFLNPQGELPLCPMCIEKVPTSASSTAVVFLCGHRFHTECANQWYLAKPRNGGRCPICNDTDGCRDAEASDGDALTCGKCEHLEAQDEAKAFFLRTLMQQFPEFISEECVKRWANCHSEIWLSELECPQYRSIFSREKKQGMAAKV